MKFRVELKQFRRGWLRIIWFSRQFDTEILATIEKLARELRGSYVANIMGRTRVDP